MMVRIYFMSWPKDDFTLQPTPATLSCAIATMSRGRPWLNDGKQRKLPAPDRNRAPFLTRPRPGATTVQYDHRPGAAGTAPAWPTTAPGCMAGPASRQLPTGLARAAHPQPDIPPPAQGRTGANHAPGEPGGPSAVVRVARPSLLSRPGCCNAPRGSLEPLCRLPRPIFAADAARAVLPPSCHRRGFGRRSARLGLPGPRTTRNTGSPRQHNPKRGVP